MIYRNKSEISQHLQCSRQKVYSMIERWEVKEVHTSKKKVWYVIVLDFIKYLLD